MPAPLLPRACARTSVYVDFVLGLVGSLPRVEFSFHQLGMAGLLGKHLVVRAMNDDAEFKYIQHQLDELDELALRNAGMHERKSMSSFPALLT